MTDVSYQKKAIFQALQICSQSHMILAIEIWPVSYHNNDIHKHVCSLLCDLRHVTLIERIWKTQLCYMPLQIWHETKPIIKMVFKTTCFSISWVEGICNIEK